MCCGVFSTLDVGCSWRTVISGSHFAKATEQHQLFVQVGLVWHTKEGASPSPFLYGTIMVMVALCLSWISRKALSMDMEAGHLMNHRTLQISHIWIIWHVDHRETSRRHTFGRAPPQDVGVSSGVRLRHACRWSGGWMCSGPETAGRGRG